MFFFKKRYAMYFIGSANVTPINKKLGEKSSL